MPTDDYIAATQPGDPGKPLVFAFHGTGGTEAELFGLAKHLVPGAEVVAPRGDVSENGALRYFRRLAEGRYDMDDLAARTVKMGNFIARHKDRNPGRQVMGFGYSNGANILASVVMKRPDLFDQIALLHPMVPWSLPSLPALKGRRVLITAGRSDPICPWPMSEGLITWFKAQGALVATEIHGGGHEIRPSELEAMTWFFGPRQPARKPDHDPHP